MDARELHAKAIVVDAHCDTLLDVAAGRRRLDERGTTGHADLVRLREGGVDAQVFALYIEPEYKPERVLGRALALFDAALGAGLAPCRSVAAIEAALARHEVAAILSLEGGEPIGTDLARLRCFARLGLGALGLVWNQRNAIADGTWEVRAAGGLTDFGRTVVAECNRLGVVVDVSHLNERGFWDVLGHSERPVIASHSNARALCDHPRNLTDEQIVALAQAGGVAGINFNAPFLRTEGTEGTASLADVVAHIEHFAELAGAEHVGLGSDFDGITATPAGLEDVSCLPLLTEALLARGFRPSEVEAVLGLNLLRVFKAVWGS